MGREEAEDNTGSSTRATATSSPNGGINSRGRRRETPRSPGGGRTYRDTRRRGNRAPRYTGPRPGTNNVSPTRQPIQTQPEPEEQQQSTAASAQADSQEQEQNLPVREQQQEEQIQNATSMGTTTLPDNGSSSGIDDDNDEPLSDHQQQQELSDKRQFSNNQLSAFGTSTANNTHTDATLDNINDNGSDDVGNADNGATSSAITHQSRPDPYHPQEQEQQQQQQERQQQEQYEQDLREEKNQSSNGDTRATCDTRPPSSLPSTATATGPSTTTTTTTSQQQRYEAEEGKIRSTAAPSTNTTDAATTRSSLSGATTTHRESTTNQQNRQEAEEGKIRSTRRASDSSHRSHQGLDHSGSGSNGYPHRRSVPASPSAAAIPPILTASPSMAGSPPPAVGGIMTIDQMMDDIPAPLPLPATRPPPPPSAPGAFRGSGPGRDREPVRPLYKGGVHVLGRESSTTTPDNDPMPREGSIYFDNEPTLRHASSSQRQDQQPQVLPFPQQQHTTRPPLLQQATLPDVEQAQEQPPTAPRVLTPGDSAICFDDDCINGNDHNNNNNTLFGTFSHKKDDPETDKRKALYWAIAAGVGAVVLIVIIIGIAVGVKKNSSNDGAAEEDMIAATAPTPAMNQEGSLLDRMFPEYELPGQTRQAILSQNQRLPQVQAFQWMANDTHWQKYSLPQRRQRFALATLYFATDGPQWFDHVLTTNTQNNNNAWLDYATHECSWYDFPNVHGRRKCFNYTAATAANLTHPWDAHFDYEAILLGADPRLLVSNNRARARVRGTLVPELALLTNLHELDMDYQDIKGTIPNELERLSNTLQHIYLTKCYFTGTVPARLFSSSRSLFLSYNYRLDASIPTTVGSPGSRIQHLLLTETNLKGTIPKEIANATRLQELFLNGNELQGQIPTEVGLLSSLKVLDLTDNRLSGSIPSEVGLATRLELLLLGANFNMNGTLPTSLANLANLQVIDIFKNNIEGHLWPELFYVNVTTNSSSSTSNSGSSSPAIAPSWPKLRTLLASENALSGSIPSEVGLIGGSLKKLFVAKNRLEFQLPTEIALLTNLECLSVAENSLSGRFPLEAKNAIPNLATDVAEDMSSPLQMRMAFSQQCPPRSD